MSSRLHPEPAAAGGPSLPAASQRPIARRSDRVSQRVTPLDRWIAARVQQRLDRALVRLELWDGSAGAGRCVGELVVRDRATLLGLALDPESSFGEAYAAGRLEIRGPLLAVLEALSTIAAPEAPLLDRLAARFAIPNSLRGARDNVQHHYDLGNAFYQRWLDGNLVYTCAYYADPQMSLEAAQHAKLDLVCRKLRLRAGDRVVEAGCGWGALALHMARHYGARVRAFNVSREQLTYARDRAVREGLAGQVEFIDDDYRNVSGQCDVFVSIGMLEHVGLRHFPSLAEVLKRSLRRDGGRGLLHFIGRNVPRPVNPWIRRRIFPGTYTPTLGEVGAQVLGPSDMSVLDVENLRLHYARTLAHWSERFAAARADVEAEYGPEFARAWELYLAGSEASFATGWLQLFQVLFAPRESAPPFWTRADMYEGVGARGASV
jgi:cyclopropane-fatty-acyl-phospholipid synthase